MGTGTTEQDWKFELCATLQCVQTIRRQLDMTELRTVKFAREMGISWSEIAGNLGTTRDVVWERWQEMDEGETSPAP